MTFLPDDAVVQAKPRPTAALSAQKSRSDRGNRAFSDGITFM
jgi:hypothetical protein